MTPLARWLGAAAAVTAVASGAAAAERDPFAELHIRLAMTAKQRSALEADDRWDDACAALGRGLTAGGGPWGLGPFAAYDCGVSTAPPAPGAWQLSVTKERTRTVLTIRYGGQKRPMARTAFDAHDWGLYLLASPDLVPLLTADLAEQLPALARLDRAALSGARPTLRGKSAGDGVPPPPAELDVYTLDFDPATKVWRPRALTVAKLTHQAARPAWRLADDLDEDGGPVFAHDAAGRRAHGPLLAKRIAETNRTLVARRESLAGRLGLDKLGDVFSGSVSSGFIGVRYGHSIMQGPVVGQMSVISLVTELRGAPLDGLRLYYDAWPETRQDAPLGAVSFKGARATLGWSFGLTPGGLIDRIDLVPKVGRWSVHSDFAVTDGKGVKTIVPFDVPGVLSFGAEAGVETTTSWVLTRLWLARDFGFSPFGKAQATTVTDNRAGLDMLLKGPYFMVGSRPLNLSFLLFGLFENVALESTKEADTPVAVNNVEYNIGYVGGGLALSW